MLEDDYHVRVMRTDAGAMRRRVRAAKRIARLRQFHAIFGPKRMPQAVVDVFVEIAYCSTLSLLRAEAHDAMKTLASSLPLPQARHLLSMTKLAVEDSNRHVTDLATDEDWVAWMASL